MTIDVEGSPAPPRPPDLPIHRPPQNRRWIRIAVLGVVQALVLFGLSAVLDGLQIDSLATALLLVVVLGALNAIVWPFVIRITLKLVLITVGLFTFVLNALFVSAAAAIVGGVEISSFWTALVIAMVVTIVNICGRGHAPRRRRLRVAPARWHTGRSSETSRPNPPMCPVCCSSRSTVSATTCSPRRWSRARPPSSAVSCPRAPIASMVGSATCRHRPGAMQAGILLGDNHNMPAFRWYEKETGRIMVTNRPKDAAEIESRQSTGDGLLIGGGASRANVFTGDTDDAMFTFSSVTSKEANHDRFLYVLSTPMTFFRIIALSVVEIVREKRAYRTARRDGCRADRSPWRRLPAPAGGDHGRARRDHVVDPRGRHRPRCAIGVRRPRRLRRGRPSLGSAGSRRARHAPPHRRPARTAADHTEATLRGRTTSSCWPTTVRRRARRSSSATARRSTPS